MHILVNIADRPNTVTPFHPSNKHGVSRSREGKDYSQNEGRSYVDFIGAGIGAGMFVIVLAIVTAICMGRRQGQRYEGIELYIFPPCWYRPQPSCNKEKTVESLEGVAVA